MALIKRETITHAERKREEVAVESLGGSVAVVQMSLTTRLVAEEVSRRQGGEPGAVFATIPHVLAGCVVDADGEQLMTAEQWSTFGANHREEVITLFNKSMELSGYSSAESAEKN
jgi:hypothetical protein